MTAFTTDLRLALRLLRDARGFTATVVLTLGLGITLCTTAVVIVNAYLMTGLPYPGAERLYWIRYAAPGQDAPREMEKLDWASLGDVIEQPIAWDLDMFYVLGEQHAQSIPGAWVTPGFVEGLGIQPAIGRGFEAGSFLQGSENVVLISHRLWQSRFGGDSGIVGRTFTAYVSDRPAEAESFRIIGVLPAGFWHINTYTDILAPLRAPTFPYMARLRQGVTPETAAARIGTVVSAGARNVPQNWRPTVVSSHEVHVQAVRPVLRMLTIAAALVLLVACGNVAGLLLVRATKRQKEIAVRSALGAGRWAIARMLLAEGLVLGALSTIVGLLITRLALASLAPLIQQQLGRSAPGGVEAFSIDARVLLFAAAITLLTTVMCTLVPLGASLRSPSSGLLSGSRTATEGRRSQRLRAGLIAAEIAVSLALLAGSTLMLRTVVSLLGTDLGFEASRVINASVTLRQNRYPDGPSRAAMFERISARLMTVSGIESVGMTTFWPLQQARALPVEIEGRPGQEATPATVQGVNGDYFATLNIPLAAGRWFTNDDRLGAEPVAVISETLARRLSPAGTALGLRLVLPVDEKQKEQRRIVGVVRDVRQGPADAELADVYVPMMQAPTRFAFVLVRTAGAPSAWLAPLAAAFRDVDPELAVDRARPMQQDADALTARPRFLASVLAAFAVAAAALALVGVYSVIAYAVRQREREIAVRIAVGADPARITGVFLRQGGGILGVGLIVGALAALAGGRLIESQLFGVTARDPLALSLAAGAFAAAGLLAIWWPARRAAATDPGLALRSE